MTESVIGPYQILGPLGAGGMGEVYKALDPRVGRQVALKLLPESMANHPDLRRRFEQEARLAAALNHPNVMAIYDVGLDRHPPYIVAELVPGESLRSMIAAGPLPPRKAVDIAAQIAAGLAAAHAAGIVHRDLKPENVIVTSEGVAKILDFGVARMETKAAAANETATLAHTSAGSVVGTAAYMSPEQARAGDVDYRSDQFSLGLVLYEMLSGKQAFSGPSTVQVMSAIIEQEPIPIERTLPTQLRWILQRCLAKEREGRYESTRDLARELAQLRDHYSELTTMASGVQPAITAAVTAAVTEKKRPVLPLWILAAVCALVGIAGWCAAQLLRDPHAVDLSRYRATPFATALVTQGLPGWSRDGKSLAFIGFAGGSSQLYVQGVDSPTAVPISHGPWDVYQSQPPFWSPDSQSIYFRCGKEDQGGLCRIPAGGGESTMVQPNARTGSLSPDGKTLAMLVFPKDDFRLEMMTATPPDAPPRKYEPSPFPSSNHYNNPVVAFAPDGKSIFVGIAFDGKGETTWLLPWPAGQARPVLPQGLPFSGTPQTSWEPDSRHLVFAVEVDASHHDQLYMADVRNGSYWPVFMEDRPASAPAVSPDGTRVAYRSNLSHADVIAVPLADGPVRTLLGSSRTEQMADASQAGPQLVYVTDRRGMQEIWLTSTAEGWDRPLITADSVQVDGKPATLFMDPALSPDGRRVAFAAMVGGNVHIYTAFVSGGTPVRVTRESGLEDEPAWSPDGNWIVFGHMVEHGFLLAKARPGNGEAPTDLAPIEGLAVPTWSPTGEWIAMHDDHGNLTLFNPDGKPARKLLGDAGPFAWSRDGKTLYQVTMGNDPTLVALDIATSKRTKLRDLPGLEPFSSSSPGLRASLTSDGKSIVYTVNRPRTEIWILDGVRTPHTWWERILGK
jgi:eukaryotic-like serine/threonine-protein kinase